MNVCTVRGMDHDPGDEEFIINGEAYINIHAIDSISYNYDDERLVNIQLNGTQRIMILDKKEREKLIRAFKAKNMLELSKERLINLNEIAFMEPFLDGRHKEGIAVYIKGVSDYIVFFDEDRDKILDAMKEL